MFVILLDKFKLVQRDGAVQYSGRELSPAMWSRSPSDLVQLIRYRVAGRRVVVEGKPVVRVIGMLSKVEEDGRRFTGRQASILLLDPRKTTSVTDSTIFKGELKGVTYERISYRNSKGLRGERADLLQLGLRFRAILRV